MSRIHNEVEVVPIGLTSDPQHLIACRGVVLQSHGDAFVEAVFARNDDDDPAPREEHGDNDDRRGQARDDEGIRRQHERMRTLKSGKIIYNNSNCVADCLILNLSDGGAALLTADFFDVPTDLVLKLGHGKTYDCEVCWQHGKKLGVRFI